MPQPIFIFDFFKKSGMKVEVKSEKTIIDVYGNNVLPCFLKHQFEYYNWKRTEDRLVVYTNLKVKEYPSGLWLVANGARTVWPERKDGVSKFTFTAPEGAIVMLEFSTGSWKHTYESRRLFFKVERAEEREHEGVVIRNLVPLRSLSKDELTEVEAEILNGVANRLSKYQPVRHLFFYWVMEGGAKEEDAGGGPGTVEREPIRSLI